MEQQKKKTKKRKDEEDIKSNVRSEEEVQKSKPKQGQCRSLHPFPIQTSLKMNRISFFQTWKIYFVRIPAKIEKVRPSLYRNSTKMTSKCSLSTCYNKQKSATFRNLPLQSSISASHNNSLNNVVRSRKTNELSI